MLRRLNLNNFIKKTVKNFSSENLTTTRVGPIPLSNKKDEQERIKLTTSAFGAIVNTPEPSSLDSEAFDQSQKTELHKDYIPTTIGGKTFSGDVNPKTGEVNGPKVLFLFRLLFLISPSFHFLGIRTYEIWKRVGKKWKSL